MMRYFKDTFEVAVVAVDLEDGPDGLCNVANWSEGITVTIPVTIINEWWQEITEEEYQMYLMIGYDNMDWHSAFEPWTYPSYEEDYDWWHEPEEEWDD